jgi:putative phage-type endonuclease
MMLPQNIGDRADRRTWLGGSDAAAVFGLSPWATPQHLYEKKIGAPESPDPDREKFFARRKRQEPVIAEMLADEYGIVVTRLSLDANPNRYVHPIHRYLAAEIDFEFEMSDRIAAHFPDRPDLLAIPNGTILNGEIKTVHPFAAGEWGEQGSEDVPIHYAAQVMHGLGVTRRPAAIVAALFGLDDLMCFPVMADQELIAAMEAKCVEFWLEHVLPRVPPKPTNIEDFKRLYGKYAGRPVELDDRALGAYRSILECRKRVKVAQDDLEQLEWQLAAYVADAWGVPTLEQRADVESNDNAILRYQGREVGSWKRQRGAFLDQKRLKAEQPGIVNAYTVQHFYRVLREKKGKS